ncbi:MAG: hypothetical protein LUF85_06150 [Bacteroides sp.]|nr:hypothetical protein [Bacteroides sp.]
MKNGFLSQYFTGVAGKRLSAVEADILKSHQHEFNGVQDLIKILGEPTGKVTFKAKFLYLTDQDGDPVIEDGFLTWYDARLMARVERGVMRWEYRLYFPDNLPLQCAVAGDYLVVARLPDNSLIALITEKDTTMESQVRWLFGLCDDSHPGFSVRADLEGEQDRIGFAARFILEQIGIEPEDDAPSFLEQMLQQFDGTFPKTRAFSAYARSTLPDVSVNKQPDEALMCWMEREEILYRTLEKHLLADDLKSIINRGDDDFEPDRFVKIVQSTLQRRKSRAGSALENHLEQIFSDYKLTYTRQGVTESRLKPDFIFPNIKRYHDPQFPSDRLTMLACKSTCKDRWRQILNEAARTPEKHLITLEPGISENQTEEMKTENVRLIIPKRLHMTYTLSQQQWLMSLDDFITVVLFRQTPEAF